MKSLQFNSEEKQLIVEALLFNACVDVCSEHTVSHRLKMLELAASINNSINKPNLHNIYLFKDGFSEENKKITKFITENFSNIPLEDVITD